MLLAAPAPPVCSQRQVCHLHLQPPAAGLRIAGHAPGLSRHQNQHVTSYVLAVRRCKRCPCMRTSESIMCPTLPGANSFIQLDLAEHRIKVTYYALRHHATQADNRLTNWVCITSWQCRWRALDALVSCVSSQSASGMTHLRYWRRVRTAPNGLPSVATLRIRWACTRCIMHCCTSL